MPPYLDQSTHRDTLCMEQQLFFSVGREKISETTRHCAPMTASETPWPSNTRNPVSLQIISSWALRSLRLIPSDFSNCWRLNLGKFILVTTPLITSFSYIADANVPMVVHVRPRLSGSISAINL